MASALPWMLACGSLAAAWAYRARLRGSAERVSRACHELRAPLTAAGLALHAMARSGEAPAHRVSALERELRRAGAALADLAAVRGRSRPIDQIEEVDVSRLLEETAVSWAPVAEAYGRELRLGSTGSGTVVHGDSIRLAQATGNLVGNAIEHGGGPIELRARPLPGRVAIEVVDGGPGLPAPVAVLVRRARAGDGWRGRGLAIASEIAARHGGRLATAPTAGGGRVALELPAAGTGTA